MSGRDERDTARLAEALPHSGRLGMLEDDRREVAAALLPVVREIADQRAAEELEAAAFGLDGAADERSGWCGPWHDFADGLRARAAALRGEVGR